MKGGRIYPVALCNKGHAGREAPAYVPATKITARTGNRRQYQKNRPRNPQGLLVIATLMMKANTPSARKNDVTRTP